jgi:hypothetical protein
MDFLRKERLEKWRSILPTDVGSAIEAPSSTDPVFVELVAKAIPGFKSATEVMGFVEQNAEAFTTLGRAGRLRFLAWVRARNYNDFDNFMSALTTANEVEGDASGTGGGIERVAPFFYSDLLALAEALGPRIAAGLVDAETLDVVAGASLEVATDYELKGRMS